MTTYRYVQCDHDGCDQEHEADQPGPNGWAYIELRIAGDEKKRTTLHLCPTHAPLLLAFLSVPT